MSHEQVEVLPAKFKGGPLDGIGGVRVKYVSRVIDVVAGNGGWYRLVGKKQAEGGEVLELYYDWEYA